MGDAKYEVDENKGLCSPKDVETYPVVEGKSTDSPVESRTNYSFAANPWCWCISFERCDRAEDAKSIPFSPPMVRAILDNRKTQTRRTIKPQPKTRPFQVEGEETGDWFTENRDYPQHGPMMAGRWRCPYGKPGDVLYVKEAWRTGKKMDGFTASEIAEKANEAGYTAGPYGPIWYTSDDSYRQWGDNDIGDFGEPARYRHARFMPRWAARIFLRVTEVRVQRVQDITEADAIAEGIRLMRDGSGVYVGREGPGALVTPWLTAREAFADLWDSINGKEARNAD